MFSSHVHVFVIILYFAILHNFRHILHDIFRFTHFVIYNFFHISTLNMWHFVTFHDVFITHMLLWLFCVLRFYIIFVTFFVTFFVIHIFCLKNCPHLDTQYSQNVTFWWHFVMFLSHAHVFVTFLCFPILHNFRHIFCDIFRSTHFFVSNFSTHQYPILCFCRCFCYYFVIGTPHPIMFFRSCKTTRELSYIKFLAESAFYFPRYFTFSVTNNVNNALTNTLT